MKAALNRLRIVKGQVSIQLTTDEKVVTMEVLLFKLILCIDQWRKQSCNSHNELTKDITVVFFVEILILTIFYPILSGWVLTKAMTFKISIKLIMLKNYFSSIFY